MKVFDTLKKTEYDTVVALGFFDGVHRGHQQVIKTCVDVACDNARAVVFTFKENPQKSISKTKKPLLTDNKQKFEKLEKIGVDEVFCVDFESVMNLSQDEFVKGVLCDTLNAKCVVTGFNYHFSKGGKADADDLARICAQYGIRAIKCEPVMYSDIPVSSTRIRECIASGRMAMANDMLGYNFCIDGKVQSGNHIGTKIDSPTINQALASEVVVPAFGVYATKVTINGVEYIGATNIGTHPTVGEVDAVCETHLIDFENGMLYGENVRTELLEFIRAEQKFDSIDDLMCHIKADIDNIKKYFNK